MPRQVVISLLLVRLREEQLQVLLASGGTGNSLPVALPLEEESLDQAAARWIASQFGRRETHLQQMHAYGEAGQPVRVVYLAITTAEAVPPAGSAYTLQPVKGNTNLSAAEATIFNHALHQLRRQVSNDILVFPFLPLEFTLAGVQQAYELIMGESQDKRNFRRQLLGSGTLSSTTRMTSGVGRPARLYRLRSRGKDPGHMP